jgi:hypothetical protein
LPVYAKQAAAQREAMKARLAQSSVTIPSWNECFGDVAQEAQRLRDESLAQQLRDAPYSWEKRMDLNSLPPGDPLRIAAMKQRFGGGGAAV